MSGCKSNDSDLAWNGLWHTLRHLYNVCNLMSFIDPYKQQPKILMDETKTPTLFYVRLIETTTIEMFWLKFYYY